ncbi:MAG: uroporphyrinogen decarboxylase family protein [bacterium]|nr:uroporphyrinogen decarboxylase family protein [bacterium]
MTLAMIYAQFMESLTSRQRLLNTLNGNPVDRIPISLYEFDGCYDSWIHQEPEYQAILDYAKDKTDKLYFWGSPVGAQLIAPDKTELGFDKSTPYQKIIFYGEIAATTLQTTTWKEQQSTFTKTILKTPKGQLVTRTRQDDGIHTGWTIEHFCKTAEDADKILSIPYIPWKPSVASFFEFEKKLGETGIILGDIPDPLCLVVDLFGFSEFLMVYVDNPELISRLLDFFQERIYQYLNHLLENDALTLYRIYGPEYATPPYLSPADFDKLVTPYVTELITLMHRFGAKARIHSHGKIKKILPALARMEPDAIDPLEPPPDGDAELSEVREVLGNKVVLIGNIEERLFEIGTKEEIADAVKKAIDEGAKDGPFILSPTAMPLTTPLDPKIQENIIHYIDCGIKYGKK